MSSSESAFAAKSTFGNGSRSTLALLVSAPATNRIGGARMFEEPRG
ncbi:hypothetical protein [Pseudonocardia sp. MH-G8]|nr:hypothetical protein [Pseudonocardia sp. MH-G8]